MRDRIVVGLIAVALVWPVPALAQTDCPTFAKMLNERSVAVARADAAVAKVQPGPREHCALAREFVDTANKLKAFAEANRRLCTETSLDGLAKINLRFDLAAVDGRITMAEDHAKRLCR